MRPGRFLLLSVVFSAFTLAAQSVADEKNPEYLKQITAADQFHQKKQFVWEIDALKSANKHAGGSSVNTMIRLARVQLQMRRWKDALETLDHVQPLAASPGSKAAVAFLRGSALIELGKEKHNPEAFSQADTVLKAMLGEMPAINNLRFIDGKALALLGKDEDARAQFRAFAERAAPEDPYRARALRFAENPGLVREKMAPPFSIVTADGTPLSLDALNGKVVLLDFWATWCGPCNVELPHVKQLAKTYAGRPFVVLSVSSDHDQAKWKEFIEKHEMTWPQYNDEKGALGALFGVRSIPHYFTIDTDGILQSENVGDHANIDSRIRKLVQQAEASAAAAGPAGVTSVPVKTDASGELANPTRDR